MPTTLDLEEARVRWQQLGEDPGLAPIARFHGRWLETLGGRPVATVALQLTPTDAERAVRAGEPLLLAGEVEVDVDELDGEVRLVAEALRDAGRGPASDVARAVASAPVPFGELAGAALRGDEAAIEAGAFSLHLPLDPLRSLLQLAAQPVLWTVAEQAATLVDLDRWQRGYCPVCGAWPLYGELVGPQRERHLRCGRCGAGWVWAILLCPYCGNDDHRTLGTLGNPEDREHRRVDVCERCTGYLKAIASYSRAPAPLLAAEDAATVHLDVAARERGYARPGLVPDPAVVGVPRTARAPDRSFDVAEG